MSKTESAYEDFMYLAEQNKLCKNNEDKIAWEDLYQWFCRADNKGTLCFQLITQKKGY